MITIFDPFFGKKSFKDIRDDLYEAIQFFDNLGIQFKKTRIDFYYKHLEKLIDLVKCSDVDAINKDYDKYFSAINESSELIRISKGLKEINDPIFIELHFCTF